MSQNNGKKPLQTVRLQQLQFYQGDVPHPEILRKLAEIDPSFPERIFKIAEESSKERIRASQAASENAKKLIDGERSFKIRGQILTFILFFLVLGVTVLLAVLGMPGAAIATCLGGFATLGASAINGMTGRK